MQKERERERERERDSKTIDGKQAEEATICSMKIASWLLFKEQHYLSKATNVST